MTAAACLDIDPADEEFDGTAPFAEPSKSREENQRRGADDWSDDAWSDEDDDWAFDIDDYGQRLNSLTASHGLSNHSALQPNTNTTARAAAQISSAVRTDILLSEKKADAPRNLGLTRDTRATVEQVLDPRTLLILGKMEKRGVFSQIFKTISTGKEANVYYATGHKPTALLGNMGEYLPEGAELAVKVYKTSILVFKDRARYVEGEFRFRRGYCKSNPRKMVAMWAEKEMRNLRRMRNAHLPCPIPAEVRQNVLVMEYVGEDGVAAPRLKDAEVSSDAWPGLYRMLIRIVRCMFQVCRLVHGDLSEYNILHFRNALYVIDVSQSVEHDHPQALEFLKRDLVNVNDFFGRMSVPVVPVRKLFDFILAEPPRGAETPVDPANALSPAEEADLDELLQDAKIAALYEEEPTNEEEIEEQVFLNTWTASHLNQVSDIAEIEKDLKQREAGGDNLYDRLVGETRVIGGSRESDTEESGDEAPAEAGAPARERRADEDDESDGTDAGDADPKSNGHKPEGMDKAAWKAQVKAERAEKRLTKMSKFDKKKRTKKKH
jgi:RIO kinase 1